MNFDDIFTAYWTQYRADSDVPDSTDPEYTVALRLANEAINHWKTFDGTYWKELFSTYAENEGGTITTDVTEYDAPDDFVEGGGSIRVLDTDGNTVQHYPIIEPHEAQFKADHATYAYFSGNPSDGYVLNINPAPSSALNGLRLDYDYYRSPTEFSTGSDITEMSNPYFIVHRMLANRFRASRNPYYLDALRDAENALSKMKMDNDSGSWDNPFQLKDRSGSSWGW
jgi:hypothetical protein